MFRLLTLIVLVCSALQAQAHVEKEAALGRALAENVLRASAPVDAEAAQTYVDSLAARLAPYLPPTGHPYRFAIVASSRELHEPRALPGGYVFVPAQLFFAARDEHEFAAMLAHAMAHLAARHGMPPVAQPDVQPRPMVYFGEMPGRMEPFEREADLLAAIALSAAGLDATALGRFLERVRPDDPEVARRVASFASRPALRSGPASDEFFTARDRVRAALPPVRRVPSLYR